MKAEIASVSETGDLHSLMADSVTVWGWSQVTRECWSSRADREMWCGEHSMKCEALTQQLASACWQRPDHGLIISLWSSLLRHVSYRGKVLPVLCSQAWSSPYRDWRLVFSPFEGECFLASPTNFRTAVAGSLALNDCNFKGFEWSMWPMGKWRFIKVKGENPC